MYLGRMTDTKGGSNSNNPLEYRAERVYIGLDRLFGRSKKTMWAQRPKRLQKIEEQRRKSNITTLHIGNGEGVNTEILYMKRINMKQERDLLWDFKIVILTFRKLIVTLF